MSVIVFTAILGGCDSLKPAPKGADRCVCFTDDENQDPKGWDLEYWAPSDNPRREAWRLRCLPHMRFFGHDVSVWVDASFTVTDLPRLLKDSAGHELSAMKHHARSSVYEEGAEIIRVGQADATAVNQQLKTYSRAGFQQSALSISCVLVRTNTPFVTQFNERWDAEIRQYPGDNTQLSLDYAAWISGLSVHHLQGVRKDNPYAVHDHADHKKRRKPYR